MRPRHCTLCGFEGRFPAAGHPPRYDAICGACGSAERHRLLALALQRSTLIHSGEKVLHFAPEKQVATYLRALGVDYLSADLDAAKADVKLDLHSISLEAASIDVVLLIHVLEHVDDQKALAEIFRILKPGGRMIAMVPLIEGWEHTYENPSIVDPASRADHFGQFDHVRWHGRDFRERMTTAGFTVEQFTASGDDCVRHGLIRGEAVFIAHSPSAAELKLPG